MRGISARRQFLFCGKLLSQAELFYDSAVALDVNFLKICKQVAAMADHLEKASAGVVVLLVLLHMLGKGLDSVGQDRDLDLGRTGVALMGLVLFDDLCFFFFGNLLNYLQKTCFSGGGG